MLNNVSNTYQCGGDKSPITYEGSTDVMQALVQSMAWQGATLGITIR